jgi:hypothetical protein
MLIIPAALFAIVVNVRRPRTLAVGAVGLVPGVSQLVFDRVFLARHRDYNLAKGFGLVPSLSNLRDTIAHTGRYFGFDAPELWRNAAVPVVAALVLLIALFWTRRLRTILPATAVVVTVIAILATPKAFDGTPSVYVAYGRVFLALPAALWFLGFVLAESRPFARPSPTLTNRLMLAVVALALVTFIVKAATFDSRLAPLRETAELTSSHAPVISDAAVRERCAEVVAAADRARTDLVIYRFDRVSTYGCGALEYGKLETLFPDYDRRTWIVHREALLRRTSFLVTGVDRQWCAHAQVVVISCTLDPLVATIAVVRTRPMPALDTWRLLGESIRPFDHPSPASAATKPTGHQR